MSVKKKKKSIFSNDNQIGKKKVSKWGNDIKIKFFYF